MAPSGLCAVAQHIAVLGVLQLGNEIACLEAVILESLGHTLHCVPLHRIVLYARAHGLVAVAVGRIGVRHHYNRGIQRRCGFLLLGIGPCRREHLPVARQVGTQSLEVDGQSDGGMLIPGNLLG